MKKLQLPSSSLLLLGLLLLVLVACKAKQKKLDQKDQVVVTETTDSISIQDAVQDNEMVIIHKPGTINQSELDSIKAAQRLLKRKQ